MIKTIIFDFGDVFINLDKTATADAFSKLKTSSSQAFITQINELYETGMITTEEFFTHYSTIYPELTSFLIKDAWNAILLDFPTHRLNFLQQLAISKQYKLILLSNTNELHIDWIKKNISHYQAFKSCFDQFYLSHEINLRKPTADIFNFVLSKNQILPDETIFIDDTKEHIDTAASLGIHTWNIDPKKEDITTLFATKSDLF
ncbi:HAD family phosphatase [Aquimarina sp. TRL1]|uniref:HAD family hydrolase n=1 Tax=Aquimarina sp. (strain TRL1) TaxID=2736252 RepID=UPI001589E8B2|nr:HAD family phosphatase [Aquimarina sp. TRL1]QKX07493.1 HAD family phosphatase [Aquimarina sp. TRL1]